MRQNCRTLILLVHDCTDEATHKAADGRGTERHPIACMEGCAMVRFGRRDRCRFNHMMDDVCFGPVVLGRGVFAAVVSTIMVLGLGLLILNLRPIRLMTALPISSARRGKRATANGNPEDSCEDQLLDVLVHCTTCTFLFT